MPQFQEQMPLMQSQIHGQIPQMQLQMPNSNQTQQIITDDNSNSFADIAKSMIRKFKLPIIVFFIALSLNFSIIDKTLIQYIPKLSGTQTGTIGKYVIKALMASVLFFISEKII